MEKNGNGLYWKLSGSCGNESGYTAELQHLRAFRGCAKQEHSITNFTVQENWIWVQNFLKC